MAATPEKKVKDKIRAVLKAEGAALWHCMPGTHGFGSSGVPDIIGIYHGVGFGIEVKAGKNKPTALQMMQIEHINAAGGIAWVINDQDPVGQTQALLAALRLKASSAP